MNILLACKQCVICLFLIAISHTVHAEKQEVKTHLWAVMDVNCTARTLSESYICQVSAYKTTLYIGYQSKKNVKTDSDKVVGAFVNTLLTGGLLLPYFLLSDFTDNVEFDEQEHRLLKREIKEIEHPANLEVDIFIDGQQIHPVRTDTSGKFEVKVKNDSVMSFYAIYDKRALVLQQDIYFK